MSGVKGKSGGARPGTGPKRKYLIKKIPLQHGEGTQFTEPFRLSPEYPNDSTAIVLAQNDEKRYGIYLNEEWYGASQALRMLEYLQEHKAWLEAHH